MKSEIKNIRIVQKYGAHGNSEKFGRWIYGKRPDGKTVACKNEETDAGGIRIWSYYEIPEENAVDAWETEFSKNEWQKILKAEGYKQVLICNHILEQRGKS